ncbi:hypothetical protein HDV04_006084 [Boothiomyces sp. JEL0838]|nr:hypothetical protein HDV04_006084 [Boothiomyces sp. JEL0838]
MESLNEMFHTQYQQLVKNVQLDNCVVLIVNGSKVSLLDFQRTPNTHRQTPVLDKDYSRTEIAFQDPHFHNVKIVAHSVALVEMLGKTKWSPEKEDQLTNIRESLASNINIEPNPDVSTVFKLEIELIDKLLKGKRILYHDIGLINLHMEMLLPILERLMLYITRASLTSLHSAARLLLSGIPDERKVYAVSITTHYAAPANIYGDYLLGMMDEMQVGTSVFVMDHDTDESGVLNYIRVHLANQNLANGIFRDPARLHVDLLGPAGKV